MSVRNEPCPQCRESVPLDARICSHCRSSLVVDLRVERPAENPRQAYHAARELHQLRHRQGGDFLELKSRLSLGNAAVLEGVTRQWAEQAASILEQHGIGSEIVLSETERSTTADAAGRDSGSRSGRRPAWRSALPDLSPGMRLAAVIAILIALVLLARLTGLIGPEHSMPGPDSPGPNDPGQRAASGRPLSSRELAGRAVESSAQLRCPRSQGAGFFIGRSLLLTNAHVLCEDTPVEVILADGRKLIGSPTRVDEWLDLALVSVPGADQPPLKLGDALSVQQGDRVMIIGSPRGLDFTVAEGIVSHPARAIMGVSYLQLDASIHPGNSGGPVLSSAGRAVAVVTLLVGPDSRLGLSVPINYLFSGPEPMLPPTSGVHDSSAWQEHIEEVARLEQQEVERLRRSLRRPALVGAYLTGPGRITAVIVRHQEMAPHPEDFSFEVHADSHRLCWATARVAAWRNVDQSSDALPSPRFSAWLERHDLTRDMYAGPAPLRLDECPAQGVTSGATLVLAGAEEGSDQVEIVPAPSGQTP